MQIQECKLSIKFNKKEVIFEIYLFIAKTVDNIDMRESL